MTSSAFECASVGELELKKFFLPLQIGDISQHRPVQRLHCGPDSILAQGLDGRLHARHRIKEPRVSRHTRTRASDGKVLLLTSMPDHSERPFVLHQHRLIPVLLPQVIGDFPEVVFSRLPLLRIGETPEQRRQFGAAPDDVISESPFVAGVELRLPAGDPVGRWGVAARHLTVACNKRIWVASRKRVDGVAVLRQGC